MSLSWQKACTTGDQGVDSGWITLEISKLLLDCLADLGDPDVNPFVSPVLMRVDGVIRALFIAVGLPGAHAPGARMRSVDVVLDSVLLCQLSRVSQLDAPKPDCRRTVPLALAVLPVFLGVDQLGPAQQSPHLGLKLPLAIEHALVAHGFALAGILINLGAIERRISPGPPSASKVDASPSRPFSPPGGLMEPFNASLQRDRKS